MTKIRFFTLVMTFCLCIVAFTSKTMAQTWPPAGMQGAGTSGSPWQITTAAQLEALALYVNTNNGNATNGVYYKLMNDIDLSGYANGAGWNPIGNNSTVSSGTRFQGNFDGNNKLVKNLTINFPTGNDIGLFGHTYRATIQNLGVENCNIVGSTNVGGLVGYAFSNNTINNCYTTGKVNGSSYVGGLVGYNDGSCKNTNCHSLANVSGSGNYVGGLVGSNSGSITISNSYAKGSVSGRDWVGGLVGGNSGFTTISNNYATGSVSGRDFVGGLAGSFSYSCFIMSNCYATGNVSGSGYCVGGLVGSNSSSIYDSYATGSVSGSEHSVGGLAGKTGGGYLNYPYNPYYASIRNCYATGSVNGRDSVGGLVGTNYMNSSIHSCVAANDVVIALSNTKNINRIVGIGGNSDTKVEKNYALATTKVQNSVGNVSITDGSDNAGIGRDINTLQSLGFYSTANDWLSVWDIVSSTSIWKICNGKGLPFLRWQGILCEGETGITNISQNAKLQIYPNPASTQLYVKFDAQEAVDYTIYSITGQILLQGKVQDNLPINIESLASGMYYLKIAGKTVKFVKE